MTDHYSTLTRPRRQASRSRNIGTKAKKPKSPIWLEGSPVGKQKVIVGKEIVSRKTSDATIGRK